MLPAHHHIDVPASITTGRLTFEGAGDYYLNYKLWVLPAFTLAALYTVFTADTWIITLMALIGFLGGSYLGYLLYKQAEDRNRLCIIYLQHRSDGKNHIEQALKQLTNHPIYAVPGHLRALVQNPYYFHDYEIHVLHDEARILLNVRTKEKGSRRLSMYSTPRAARIERRLVKTLLDSN